MIAGLRNENEILCKQLSEWKGRASEESECRRQIEEEACQLRQSHQQLQDRVQSCEANMEVLQSSILKFTQGLDYVLPILTDLKAGGSFSVA